MNPLRLTFVIYIGVLVVSAVCGWILRYRLYRRLESLHPEVYARLGRPSLIWRKSMENNWKTFWFLMRDDRPELRDAETERLCRLLKWVSLLQLFLGVLLVAGMLFSHGRLQ